MNRKPIQPKQVVNLHLLQSHDRFVFITNKKIVWQVVEHTTSEYKGETKKVTRCIDDNLNVSRFDSNRSVMFLRSNDPYAMSTRKKRRQLIDY